MARRTGWIGRAAGGLIGLLAFAPGHTPAADDVTVHAAQIVADLQDLREPVLFEHDGYDVAALDGDESRITLHDVRFAPLPTGYGDAGEVVLHVSATTGGYRLTGIDLPAEMAFLAAEDGAEIGTMRLAGYYLRGDWSIAEQDFLSLEGGADEFHIEDRAAQTTITVSAMRSSLVDTPDGAGLWNEVGEIGIGVASVHTGGADTTLGSLTARWTIERMDRAKAKALDRIVADAISRLQEQSGAEAEADTEPLRRLESPFAGADLAVEARGVRYDAGDGRPTSIARLRVEMSAADLDRELSRLALRLSVDGIDAELPGGEAGALERAVTPQALDLSLAVEDLPGRDFWSAMLDGIAPADMPHEESIMRLGLALQAAGTKLRLESSRLSAPASEVFAEGLVQAHAPAALGAVAAFTVDLVGLEALTALAREPGGGEMAVGIRDFMAWFETYGTPATAPNGAASRRLDIAIDETGELTVNGQPLPLFGAPPGEMEN